MKIEICHHTHDTIRNVCIATVLIILISLLHIGGVHKNKLIAECVQAGINPIDTAVAFGRVFDSRDVNVIYANKQKNMED